jgi:hypothetical protein
MNVETLSSGINGIANILYFLRLQKNLLNIGKITNILGYIIVFDESQCLVIRRKDHQVITRGIQDTSNGFYHLDMKTLIESSQVNAIDNSFYVRMWHHKLGRLNYRSLKFVFENEMATCMDTSNHAYN